MTKMYADAISEKYRKYIIKVKPTNQKPCYLLWGTDLDKEDNDYLMLDSFNNIIAFTKIKDLIAYVKQTTAILDFINSCNWAKAYKRNSAYTSYDLLAVSKFIKKVKAVNEYDEHNAMQVIDFINLFSDYAFQLNDACFLKLYRDKDVDVFRDYLNLYFFWKNTDQSNIHEMNIRLETFEFLRAKEKINEMIFIFEQHLILV